MVEIGYVLQKEMQSKVSMLSDEVKRKTQQAALQQDEAAQARANEAAALKKAALLEQQVADLQVGPVVFTLLQPLNIRARSSLENVGDKRHSCFPSLL